MEKRDQILAALKKLGPASPTQISNSVGIEPSLCGYHMRALLRDGKLKVQGKSIDRRYALPSQEFEGPADAPPPDAQAEKRQARRQSQARDRAGRRGNDQLPRRHDRRHAPGRHRPRRGAGDLFRAADAGARHLARHAFRDLSR